MSNPMTDYSDDSLDFLRDFHRKAVQKSQVRFNEDIVREFGESYERAYQLWNTFYAEAYKDLSFYLGNQWSLEEIAYLNNQRRSAFTYNKIRRVVNMVQGYQRKNRLATIISPIENSSEMAAEIFTDTMQYIMSRENGYEMISDAFKGALTTGVSFLSPWVDYRDDPVNGDIRFKIDDWNSVILDPFVTQRDLSDCGFVARRKFLSRDQIKSLIPNKSDIIDSLPYGSRDDKFTYMPFARQWGMQKLLNYTEYWRTKWENKEVLVDMTTGDTLPWKGNRDRLNFVLGMEPNLKLIRKPVRTVELGIIVEGQLLYYGKDPYGLDDYPFVPFFAIFEPSYDLYTWKIQSLVRIVRDPQTELNKRRSKMVDIIDSQLNSGWIFKTGAVTNISSLFKSGQSQQIALKPEASMDDIRRIEAPQIPNSMFQLEAEFEKDIMEIAGVNSELFGMSENEKIETAGVLAKMRQAAGLINLQDLFDGLRQSQQLLGRKVLTLIQNNYSPEKIQMITKKQVPPEFFTKTLGRYDVVVEEGILTDTQKQSNFVQLLALKSMGIPVPDSLVIENSNLHDKRALIDTLNQQAEAQKEVEDLNTKLMLENQAVLTQSVNAKAESDRALAAERINKISLDAALSAERISRAEEDRTAGVLNLLKAARELEGMDLQSLAIKLQMIQSLEAGQQAKEQPVSDDSQAAKTLHTPNV